MFQIWSEEGYNWLFRVENRRHAVVSIQRQLLAVRRRTLSYWLLGIRSFLVVIRSR